MKLETPLFQKQIDAAGSLWQHLQQWKLSDAALITLHEKLPGFEPGLPVEIRCHKRDLRHKCWQLSGWRSM